MKIKRVCASLIMAVLMFCFTTAVFAKEPANSSLFSVMPAVSFSWFPKVSFTEENTITTADIENYGMSFVMGLKFFDKYGASLNLTIDDPKFQKMVDFAGTITAHDLILKFDIHTFGGNVIWDPDLTESYRPNPIPGGYDFKTQFNSVSLMYRWDQLLGVNLGLLGAAGISYSSISIPVEYQVLGEYKVNLQDIRIPGFGNVKANLWGFSMYFDSLTPVMEMSKAERKYSLLRMEYLDLDWWIYTDFVLGMIGKANYDEESLKWMATQNDVESISDKFSSPAAGNPLFMRYTQVIGIKKVWDVGQNARIGLAIGGEGLLEWFSGFTDDFAINYDAFSIGPTIRFTAKF